MSIETCDLLEQFDNTYLPAQVDELTHELTDLAHNMAAKLPENERKAEGMRKLLEAREAFIMAAFGKVA